MRPAFTLFQYMLIAIVLVCMSLSALAEESRYDKAHAAVTNLLFDYDNSEEYASFKVSPRGHVDITFASNTPDKLYEEIISKLKKHPDIKGVLAGRGGSACSLF